MSILLIDCYLDPKGGEECFPYLPSDTSVWHVSQGDPNPPSEDISGVVITGLPLVFRIRKSVFLRY